MIHAGVVAEPDVRVEEIAAAGDRVACDEAVVGWLGRHGSLASWAPGSTRGAVEIPDRVAAPPALRRGDLGKGRQRQHLVRGLLRPGEAASRRCELPITGLQVAGNGALH